MKEYYTIYECSEGRWYMEGGWWMKDKDYVPVPMTTDWDLIDHNNGLGVELVRTQSKTVITVGGSTLERGAIHKFETYKEAEGYLVSNNFSTQNGEFYTVRKIWF